MGIYTASKTPVSPNAYQSRIGSSSTGEGVTLSYDASSLSDAFHSCCFDTARF